MTNAKTSGIKSVSFYVASPVECCDRCGQGIKYVSVVTFRDGSAQKFGMDCIEKILNGDNSLLKLFRKNVKMLQKYRDYLAILQRPFDQMPKGSEYYNAGFNFIADSEGKDIFFKSSGGFHPIVNMEKNQAGTAYVVQNEEERFRRDVLAINQMVEQLKPEITRLEKFVAYYINKGLTAN